MKKVLFITAVLAIIAQLSFAQKFTRGIPDNQTFDFVTTAANANVNEIAAGRLAGKKGHLPAVKAYGDKMVDHHTHLLKQMAAMIKAKHLKIAIASATLAVPDSSLIKASGPEFDRIYISMMLADHQKAVALFEGAANNLSDPDLKAFAAKTLPMLREHLAETKNLAAQTGASMP